MRGHGSASDKIKISLSFFFSFFLNKTIKKKIKEKGRPIKRKQQVAVIAKLYKH